MIINLQIKIHKDEMTALFFFTATFGIDGYEFVVSF